MPYSHWGEQVTHLDLPPNQLLYIPNLSECLRGDHETKLDQPEFCPGNLYMVTEERYPLFNLSP